MFARSIRWRRVAGVALVLAAATPAVHATAMVEQSDASCLEVDGAVAVQMPGETVLTGSIDVPERPILAGQVSPLDGSRTARVDDGAQFELPLGTRSGDWYVSSLVAQGCEAHFTPADNTLVQVRHLTRITPTTPDQYVAYGRSITVGGILEGWTQETGWQPLASRPLDVWRQWYDPSPVHATTDANGAYTATVTALEVAAAGSAQFAGDDIWLRAAGNAFIQVHARISIHVSDTTPAVGQRVRVTGRVAPANTPVRLEQLRDDTWTVVSGPITTGADGRYALSYRPTTRGTTLMRAWTDGTETEGNSEGVYPYFKEFSLHVHR